MDYNEDTERLAFTVQRTITRWLLIPDKRFVDFVVILWEELNDEYDMNG